MTDEPKVVCPRCRGLQRTVCLLCGAMCTRNGRWMVNPRGTVSLSLAVAYKLRFPENIGPRASAAVGALRREYGEVPLDA